MNRSRILLFIILFLIFYGLNLAFIGLVAPPGIYNAFIDAHFNYIRGLRVGLLQSAAAVLALAGYATELSSTTLSVTGKGAVSLSYGCLGLGVGSLLTALAITGKAPPLKKILFGAIALVLLQVLNVFRLVLLLLYWQRSMLSRLISHHALFNGLIYLFVLFAAYLWLRKYG